MATQPVAARNDEAASTAASTRARPGPGAGARIGSVDAPLPPVQVTQQGELHLNPALQLEADQILFVAEVRSLCRRVSKNGYWARQELFLLLEDAANAGILAGDLAKGEVLLNRAQELYQRALLARNRIHYVNGTAAGVVALIVLAAIVVQVANSGFASALAPPAMLVALFAFAGIGSVTSVLIRLSSLDLKEETSKFLLMLSGASKPLVAIAFASIVYIVLKYKLVAIAIGNGSDADPAYWVAAFLCGFSERFGSDIIARLEPQATAGR